MADTIINKMRQLVIYEREGYTTSYFFEEKDRTLPDEADGTLYIVSKAMANICDHRNDLIVPNEIMKSTVKDAITCRSFTR